VIIAGGFHREGGMDKLNAAWARYLIAQGTPVHLVGHHFADEFANGPAVRLYRVAKFAGSFFLGQALLDRMGGKVAARVSAHNAAARVLVNGVNCAWPGLNWIHFLHHAEPRRSGDGPRWIKAKNRLESSRGIRRETALIPRAQRLIANSERTRHDLINRLDVRDERVVTVYPGSDASYCPATTTRRASARRWLGLGDEPVVAFVGALRHDHHKGFDTLWRAWCRLSARVEWNARLVVAGGGRMLDDWRRIVAQAGQSRRIILLGHTSRVQEVLAASDVLISPTRYDAYGLNVHEAICCGVPAIVSASAGVAERFPPALRDMLIADPEDADDLMGRLLAWSEKVDCFKHRFESFGRMLRASTEAEMAARIASLASSTKAREINGSSSYTSAAAGRGSSQDG
jgi:glycosyltransferase involved in cell wall biosynthesis